MAEIRKVLFFVNTEYHLLLAVNQIVNLYSDTGVYDVELFIRGGKQSKRLNREYDFSDLPVRVSYFEEKVSSESALSNTAKKAIQGLMDRIPDIFVFFQEQDVLMVILSGHYYRKGAEVILCQDGLKPYARLQFHSLGLFLANHRQNLWLKKYGFRVDNWFSPIVSKQYGFLKGITSLYLTSPEVYRNWNGKKLNRIEFLPVHELDRILSKLFRWDDSSLPVRDQIIFYMNQPMKGTNLTEVEVLNELIARFPQSPIVIKAHPLTSDETYALYESLGNVSVIRSTVPAELFIIKLKGSVILSINSTSMLLGIPGNKYYYLYRLFEKELKRLSRMKVDRYPAPHALAVNATREIEF